MNLSTLRAVHCTIVGHRASEMDFDSVISPTRNVVPFVGDGYLIEAVYEDEELRRLVPHIDDMLGDITATEKCQLEAGDQGEDYPEWDDPDYAESSDYAKVARVHLINAGCIFAEEGQEQDEEVVYFTGLANALKRSFNFCLKVAGDSHAILKIVRPSASPPNETGVSRGR